MISIQIERTDDKGLIIKGSIDVVETSKTFIHSGDYGLRGKTRNHSRGIRKAKKEAAPRTPAPLQT